MTAYRVKFERIAVAGGTTLKIRSLLDRLQYSDRSGAAAAAGVSSANWPLFGLVWPSSRRLAELMQEWNIGRRSVLEIGCGLGLASLVVHRRQVPVTASDCHPLAESFLRANLRLNGLPGLQYRRGDWNRANPDLGRFDLIVGSDVLYERDHPQHLVEFIDRHAMPRCEVLIIDPDRGNRSAFSRGMRSRGYDVNESIIDHPGHDGTAYRGRLLRYRRLSR